MTAGNQSGTAMNVVPGQGRFFISGGTIYEQTTKRGDSRLYLKMKRKKEKTMKHMKKLAGMILTAATALSFAGCSSTEPAGSGSDPTGTPEITSQKMTVAVPGQFTTMDPGLNTETNNSYVLSHLYSAMFQRDVNGSIVPMLAEDYDVSEDGLVYTFYLKDGIKWSDGTPITAQDFEYTYLRNLSYGADNAFAVYNLQQYIAGASEYSEKAYLDPEFDCTKEDHSEVGVKAIDDKTFELTLKMPCSYLTLLMCSGAWEPLPQSTPQHTSTWSLEAGNVTSGPYTLSDLNINEKAVAVKNENYYDADSITMDEISFIVMSDQSSQSMAFEAEEIDVALSVSNETATNYMGTENLFSYTAPTTYCVSFNTGVNGPEWAKDINVRKALAKAIDTDSIVEVLGGDSFFQKLEGFVPAGVPGASGDYRTEGDNLNDAYELAYDPEGAAELLAQAGYDEANPLHIVYRYSNSGNNADLATILQEQWASVGVEVEFSALESGVYWDQFDQGLFELCRYGLSVSHPITGLDVWTTGMQIVPAVSDEKFDQLMLDAKWAGDVDEALNICHEAEEYLVDEMAYIVPLYQPKNSILVQKSLSGYELHGSTLYWGYCTNNK